MHVCRRWCGHCQQLKPKFIDAAKCASPSLPLPCSGLEQQALNDCASDQHAHDHVVQALRGIAGKFKHGAQCAISQRGYRRLVCRQLDGKTKLGAVNCDDEKQLCAEFGIQVCALVCKPRRRPPVRSALTARRRPPRLAQPGVSAGLPDPQVLWQEQEPPPGLRRRPRRRGHGLVLHAAMEQECAAARGTRRQLVQCCVFDLGNNLIQVKCCSCQLVSRSAAAELGRRLLGSRAQQSKVVAQVTELTSPEVFKKHCTGETDGDAKQLCVVAFLPDILDSKAEGRNRHIAVLKKLAEHFKDRPYSYMWAAGGAHSDLEGNVGVGGFGYPALVALSPAKGVCVPSRKRCLPLFLFSFAQ